MEVKNQLLITEFSRQHADARTPLEHWLATVIASNWSNYVELKEDFPQCDYIPK